MGMLILVPVWEALFGVLRGLLRPSCLSSKSGLTRALQPRFMFLHDSGNDSICNKAQRQLRAWGCYVTSLIRILSDLSIESQSSLKVYTHAFPASSEKPINRANWLCEIAVSFCMRTNPTSNICALLVRKGSEGRGLFPCVCRIAGT